MVITEPAKKIPIILEMLFSPEWLDSKSDTDPQGRTNREVETEVSGAAPTRPVRDALTCTRRAARRTCGESSSPARRRSLGPFRRWRRR